MDDVCFLITGFVSCEPAIFVGLRLVGGEKAKENMKEMKNEMKNTDEDEENFRENGEKN